MKTSLKFIDDYQVLALIGDGGQANVYLCCRGFKLYAVKMFNCGTHRAEQFIKQNCFLSVINHQNLIKKVDSKFEALLKYSDDTQIKKSIIVLQYAAKGDLFEYISITKGFKAQFCRALIIRILNGLQYLGQKGISHRDLKPQNLLFNENFDLKISDFGLSTLSEGSQKNYVLKTKVGTEGFRAPEVDQGSYNGQKADIFSLGVILFLLYVGTPPFFTSKKTDKIYKNIINKNYQKFWSIHERNKPKGYFPQNLKQLLNSLLSSNPQDRLSLEQIKQHQWMTRLTSTQQQLKNQLISRFQKIVNQSQSKRNTLKIIQEVGLEIVKQMENISIKEEQGLNPQKKLQKNII